MKYVFLTLVFGLASIWVTAQVQPRTPLLEVFTSSTCGPCYFGNISLNETLDASDGNWTCIKYQMYFPGDGDPYFTEEGYSRSRFYDLGGVPQLQVDGKNEMHPGNLTGEMLEGFQAIPSDVNLTAHFTREGKIMEVDVTIEPTRNILTPFLKLFVAVIENKTYNNVENNGETEFEYVMKKMLPGSLGEQVAPLKTGQPQTFSFMHEFQGEYRLPVNALDPIDHETEHSVEEFEDLSVLVWVQNRTTHEVLQSTWATLTTGTVEEKTDGNGIIALFPNPASERLHLHYQVKSNASIRLSILDLAGNVIKAQNLGYKSYGNFTETIDVSDLTAGSYLLKLDDGNRVYSKSFSRVN